jgi:hypothetical protein
MQDHGNGKTVEALDVARLGYFWHIFSEIHESRVFYFVKMVSSDLLEIPVTRFFKHDD